MSSDIAVVIDSFFSETNFASFVLVFIRLITLISITPFLGANTGSSLLRIGLGLLLSIFFFNNIEHAELHLLSMYFCLLACKELLVGFCLGFIAAQVFYVSEIAGRIIDFSRATSQVELMVPSIRERSSAFGSLLVQFTITLFFITGMHVIFFTALADSFVLIPIHSLSFSQTQIYGIAEEFIQLLASIFTLGFRLAAPVVITCFVVDVALGLINRIAGQIDAYFMSLPAKSLAGVLMFYCALSISPEQCMLYASLILSKLWNVLAHLQPIPI